MKFQLVINMERVSPEIDMRDLERHTLEMVQMADAGGFHIVWAAEHHALELFIAPNPFAMLTWFAAHTSRIRLGTAVAVAPYWHPIRLAEEVGLLDLYSRGRVEFGIGSGAFQREFDRMAPGLKQTDGHLYMEEMLPVLKRLWAGDTEHNGKYWQFALARHLRHRRAERLQHPVVAAVTAILGARVLQAAAGDGACRQPGRAPAGVRDHALCLRLRSAGAMGDPGFRRAAADGAVREPVQESRRRKARLPRAGRSRCAQQQGIRDRVLAAEPDVRHARRGDPQAQALRGAGRRPLHLLRDLRTRLQGTEALPRALHQGSHAGVRRARGQGPARGPGTPERLTRARSQTTGRS